MGFRLGSDGHIYMGEDLVLVHPSTFTLYSNTNNPVKDNNMWLKRSNLLLLACTASLASASSLTSYEFMFGNSKHITHPIIDPT
jgi:hypothetical protein